MKALASTLIGFAILLMVVVPSVALAADALFLKLDGIEGDSTDLVHLREIVLLSYSQSFTRPPGGPVQANCGAVTVTKLVDRSSPALIGAVLSGNLIRTGVITFLRDGGSPIGYYKVTLTDVLIQAITQTDASPTDPTTILEQLSMSAVRFNFEYTPQRPDGSPGSVVTFGWDCVANRPA